MDSPPSWRVGHEALALVILDLAAVLDGEGLEPGLLEPAAGQNQHAFGPALDPVSARNHGGDDGLNVLLDVDAGLLLELVALRGIRLELPETFAEVRRHQLVNVGVGDDRRIGRDILELVWTGRPGEGYRQTADVRRHEPGGQSDGQNCAGAEHEVPRPIRHRSLPPA